jgi:hypothetical protein
MPGSKKRFKDLSPTGRMGASVLFAVGLLLVVAAERDIQRRPASELRGGRLVWRLVCLNALGALGYFFFGRRGRR